jgi:hypothetical protein
VFARKEHVKLNLFSSLTKTITGACANTNSVRVSVLPGVQTKLFLEQVSNNMKQETEILHTGNGMNMAMPLPASPQRVGEQRGSAELPAHRERLGVAGNVGRQ